MPRERQHYLLESLHPAGDMVKAATLRFTGTCAKLNVNSKSIIRKFCKTLDLSINFTSVDSVTKFNLSQDTVILVWGLFTIIPRYKQN